MAASAARRRRQRRSKRTRRFPVINSADPLERAGRPLGAKIVTVLALGAASLSIHTVAGATISWVSRSFKHNLVTRPTTRPVSVVVRQPKPKPKPPAEQTTQTPQPKSAPPTKPALKKQKTRRRRRKKKAAARPVVADPVGRTAKPKPVAKVRRVVGLSYESTVEGGNGPTFAVGNTRMGRSSRRAAAPKTVRPLNQVAQLPEAKVVLVRPQRVKRIKPVYPPRYRAQGLEGDVVVSLQIGADGRIVSLRVVRPAKHPAFNESARAAARRERFSPATRDGVPIPFRISFTYRFRLNE